LLDVPDLQSLEKQYVSGARACHRLIRHNATVPQLKAGLLAG
jgi:hypothetical protein